MACTVVLLAAACFPCGVTRDHGGSSHVSAEANDQVRVVFYVEHEVDSLCIVSYLQVNALTGVHELVLTNWVRLGTGQCCQQLDCREQEESFVNYHYYYYIYYRL